MRRTGSLSLTPQQKAAVGVQRQLLGCRGSQTPVPPLLPSSLPEAAPSPEVLGCCNRISPLLTALDSVFLGTALPKTLENRKQLKALLASFLASAPPFPFSKRLMNKISIFSLKSLGLQFSLKSLGLKFGLQGLYSAFRSGRCLQQAQRGKPIPDSCRGKFKVQARFWVET